MARVNDPDQIESKRDALIALFPYAVRWERGGDRRMFDAYSDIFMVSRAKQLVGGPIVALLDEASPNSPNWVVALMLPYEDWGPKLRNIQNAVTGWAVAAFAVPYTEELCQRVVDTLLQIASKDHLLSLIPVNMWAWLKKRPSLPPICHGRKMGTNYRIVRRVRELGDVEILEAYFLLVWSEWDYVSTSGPGEMCTSIREDFGGIGMWRHREVLIKRLDHVLGQLDRGPRHLMQHHTFSDECYIGVARRDYEGLKGELLKVDKKASEILTGGRLD